MRENWRAKLSVLAGASALALSADTATPAQADDAPAAPLEVQLPADVSIVEGVTPEPGTEIPFPVDVVDVFVNSELAGAVADEAVAVGAKAVWFQLGVVDPDAYGRTRAAGLDMVMDRCPAIESSRLGTRG